MALHKFAGHKNLFYRCVLILGVLFFVLLFMITTPSYANDKHQILFISSYNSRFPTFFQQIEGLKDRLTSDDYIIDVEFMDAKRFNTDENVQSFEARLSYKLSKANDYELIIASDDNALQFVLSHQEDYFKNKPIVFFGINERSLAEKADNNPLVTGVFEQVSIANTLTLASEIMPKATRVYVISDDTLASQGDLIQLNSVKSAYPKLAFEILDMRALTFEDLEVKLQNISQDEIILLLAAYDDAAGVTISFEDVLHILNDNAKAPVFHLYEHGIGEGLIGGNVVSHYTQGLTAAALVNQILTEGTSPRDIPVVFESPNIAILDYDVFTAHNLDESLLIESVNWINREPSFIMTYFNYIIAAIGIIIALVFFSSYLLFYIKKAKNIEKTLIERSDELKDLYEELSASEEELRAQNETLMTTQSTLKQQRSELIRKQKLIEDYAYYDFLTHLPNRYSLKLDILKLLEKHSTSVIKGAIFFIDFDNFKQVNDTYGHSMGDALLIQIAKHIEKQLDNIGKVYRLGGDEFVAMLDTSYDYETVDYIAKKLYASFDQPLMVKETPFWVTFSMGIALLPLHGTDFDTLIGSADMAMYAAKNAGKNQYRFFDESTKTKAAQMKHMQDELTEALANDELKLEYQPIYDAEGKNIVLTEAMLRWHSTKGVIPPNQFLPMAQELGVMNAITRYVFNEAFDLVNILESGRENILISINVSNQDLANSILALDLEQLISKTHVNPSNVSIEVPEPMIEANYDTIQNHIIKLHDLGFKITIDNLGTEYLSLNYLKKLPIDFVKIDISLFYDYLEKPTMMISLIEILRDMNVSIIIKNVENESDLQMLSNIDYDFVQGHHYSKPVEKEHIVKMILDEDIKIYHPLSH